MRRCNSQESVQCGTSARSNIVAHKGIQSQTDTMQMHNASSEMSHESGLSESMQIETALASNQRSVFVQTDKVVCLCNFFWLMQFYDLL